jgi:uncharacterized membrane protein
MHAAAFGAAIVCALLLLQYAHRRRPFILLWAAGWLLIAPAMLLQAHHYSTAWIAESASGLSEFLAICTATLYLSSADVFRETQYVQPARLKLLIVVAACSWWRPSCWGGRRCSSRGISSRRRSWRSPDRCMWRCCSSGG